MQVGTQTVVDSEAFDRPIYEWHEVCTCGAYITGEEEGCEHMEMGHCYGTKRVQVGTEYIEATTHEEPVYEDVWVVDEVAVPPSDETVIVGYYCSDCGTMQSQ